MNQNINLVPEPFRIMVYLDKRGVRAAIWAEGTYGERIFLGTGTGKTRSQALDRAKSSITRKLSRLHISASRL